jgi:hypothetical protein
MYIHDIVESSPLCPNDLLQRLSIWIWWDCLGCIICKGIMQGYIACHGIYLDSDQHSHLQYDERRRIRLHVQYITHLTGQDLHFAGYSFVDET